MNLAVIVPVLNEAAGIRDFIFHLRERLPAAEIIVVDGGSNDETWDQLERVRDELSGAARAMAWPFYAHGRGAGASPACTAPAPRRRVAPAAASRS